MRKLEILPSVRGDMERHRAKHKRAMADIAVRLQEIAGSEVHLANLTQSGFGGDRFLDKFFVGEWESQKQIGRKLRYLKIWEVENRGDRFRVIYAHHPVKDTVYVLAIAPREFDYDHGDPITKRIEADYDKLELPIL